MKFVLIPVLAMACALSAGAQSRTLEIRASGEYRAGSGEPAQTSKQLALADARRKLLRDLVGQLQALPEVKAIPLKPNQIDAFLPTLVDISEEAGPAGNDTLFRTNVVARVSVPQVARRLDQLRKDPTAVAGLMEVWSQNEALHQQRTAPGSRSVGERDLLLGKLHTNEVVAQIYTALAKTEESSASARVTSEKGRQRAWHLAEVSGLRGSDSAEAHMAMGDIHLDAELRANAEEEYRQALRLTPNSSRPHIRLAESLRVQDKVPEAIAELREALRIDPRSAEAHTDLGYILDGEEEIAEYRQAIRLDPDFVDAHNHLAIALARQGKIPEAVEEFREIIRIDPDSVLGYYNLGIAVADLDKDDESAAAFRQALRINPNHFNARYNLGEMLRLEGKMDEAVGQFREYLRLAPDTPQNQRNIRRARDFVNNLENR